MVRLQNVKVRNGRDGKGLVVDYDKDTGKNTREQTRVDTSALMSQAHENALRVYCAACGTKGLELINVKAFPGKLKTRRTDDSLVLKQAKHVLTMRLSRGEEKLLQREAGMERQYRLNCTRCDMALAYRPVAATETCDFLYVFDGAMRESLGGKARTKMPLDFKGGAEPDNADMAATPDDVALLLGRNDDDDDRVLDSYSSAVAAKRQKTEDSGAVETAVPKELTKEQILRQALIAKTNSQN
jgi:hypothetical protein